MPIYEYQCEQCGRRHEWMQKMSDPRLTTCEVCGGPLKKLVSSSAVQFKGSGWYVTDYARKGGGGSSGTSGSKGDGEGKGGGSESSGGGASESKSESKPSESKGGESKGGESKGGESKGSDSKGSDSKAKSGD